MDPIRTVIRRLDAQTAAGNRTRQATERGELLTYFMDGINRERKGTKWRPVSIKYVAFKLTAIGTKDLYALKSKCDDSVRRGYSFGGTFHYEVKPKTDDQSG